MVVGASWICVRTLEILAAAVRMPVMDATTLSGSMLDVNSLKVPASLTFWWKGKASNPETKPATARDASY